MVRISGEDYEVLQVLADVLVVIDHEHGELRRRTQDGGVRACSSSGYHRVTIRPEPPREEVSLGDNKQTAETCEVSAVVGATGFEPATPWSRTKCATRLRYAP